ncbi:hotdog fold thioesterase [uncultured Arthrobacter sp.]|uniref:hotdog fold thioesterase n=1 Tax=uncultured Arthrobacter sp. TaxID=114050 RepID=UPI0025D20CC0|nr:hotdog fold thioesterase [uncultured Arthrobacter sp.]
MDSDVRTAGPAAPRHQILAEDHASAWLGIELLEVGEGSARIAMTVRPEMLNGFGIAHGGMIFAFADSAFALACNPASPGADSASGAQDAGTVTVASGADITFLSPVRAGEVLTAVAERRAAAGRSGLYDITITAHDGAAGRPVAEFRGRSRTVPAPARSPKAKDPS